MHPHLLQPRVGLHLLIPQEYQEFLGLRSLCCCSSLLQLLTRCGFGKITLKIADVWVWGLEEILPWGLHPFPAALASEEL